MVGITSSRRENRSTVRAHFNSQKKVGIALLTADPAVTMALAHQVGFRRTHPG